MSIAPLLAADSEAAALEQLHELGCTDGLPVVVPTRVRVDRMVLAMGCAPDISLGQMGPNFGECTMERLATAAVMAGCTPDYASVVVAAAKAILDPAFDLTEMQSTTYATAPLIIVNGAARLWAGIEFGYGALGPGFRANASIGRAVRLAMINIGGGRAGSSDMALLGHAGKFTMCLGEDEEGSPFAPLHEDRGCEPDSSAVTVIGADAPSSIMINVDADDPSCADRMLASFALAFASPITNNIALRGGQAALALNPDHAQLLADCGHTRRSIAEGVCERAFVLGSDLAQTAGYMQTPDPARKYACFNDPDDLLVFVAGGGGLYSAAFASWCAGPHRNQAVTVAIETDASCEIPQLRGNEVHAMERRSSLEEN